MIVAAVDHAATAALREAVVAETGHVDAGVLVRPGSIEGPARATRSVGQQGLAPGVHLVAARVFGNHDCVG